MKFASGSVPVLVAARVYGKDPCWVRSGIIAGWLPIGYATCGGRAVTLTEYKKGCGRVNFYISPKKLYEETGFMWEGRDV